MSFLTQIGLVYPNFGALKDKIKNPTLSLFSIYGLLSSCKKSKYLRKMRKTTEKNASQSDGRTDGWTDWWTDGQRDRWIDGPTDGQTGKTNFIGPIEARCPTSQRGLDLR